MSNKQGVKSSPVQAVEGAPAQPQTVATVLAPVFIPVSVTATLSVPTKYLEDIERSTETVRAFMESLAQEFNGVVLTADIK